MNEDSMHAGDEPALEPEEAIAPEPEGPDAAACPEEEPGGEPREEQADPACEAADEVAAEGEAAADAGNPADADEPNADDALAAEAEPAAEAEAEVGAEPAAEAEAAGVDDAEPAVDPDDDTAGEGFEFEPADDPEQNEETQAEDAPAEPLGLADDAALDDTDDDLFDSTWDETDDAFDRLAQAQGAFPAPDDSFMQPEEGYVAVSAAKPITPSAKQAKAAKKRMQAAKQAKHGKHGKNAAAAKPVPALAKADAPAKAVSTPAKATSPSAAAPKPKKKRGRKGLVAALVLVLAAGGAAGGAYGYQWYRTHPVDITIDGETYIAEGEERTINGLLDDDVITLSAGDHLAIDGSVLEEGGGKKDTLKLNGTKVDDEAKAQLLQDGDELTISRGKDTTEDSTEEDDVVIPHTVSVSGSGSIHLYTKRNGTDGKKSTVTGKESGIVQEQVTKKAQNVKMVKYSADTDGEKVIALTFDDGPWPTTTKQILKLLEKYNAKATFFTIGRQIADRPELVERMQKDGFQICTHTYDHAEGSGEGVNITYMSKSEQREEITKGFDAIKKVTGEDASTVVRLPGGNMNNKTVDILSDLVTAEIGWDVDTRDWEKPGVNAIYKAIMSAKPGDIVLMHDGGGDRSQTVKALKKALPKLVEEGYEFVTIDELLEDYPPE